MPSTFPYLFLILGLSPVSYDFTPGGYPDTPALRATSRACRVSLSAVGNCILGPMGFMGSNSRITGTLTHEYEIKGTDFHGQLQMVCRCVFFLPWRGHVTLLVECHPSHLPPWHTPFTKVFSRCLVGTLSHSLHPLVSPGKPHHP